MPKLELDTVRYFERTGYPAPHDEPVKGRFYQQVSRAAGIEDFAVNLVTLEPGTWSSQRHWHEIDDEFTMVLSGEAVLVDNDGRTPMKAGDVAVFPKGDGNGHHLINESDAPVRLIVVGPYGGKGACRYSDVDLDLDFAAHPGFRHKDGTPY